MSLAQRLLFPLPPWESAFVQTYREEMFLPHGRLINIPRTTYTFTYTYNNGVIKGGIKEGEPSVFPALWVPRPCAKYTCLLFHANGENLSNMLECCKTLSYFLDANVLCPEYPGYGNYRGRGIRLSVQAVEEIAVDSMAYLKQAGCPEERIIIVGRSLGSGPAVYLGTLFTSVRALLLLCPFTNIEQLAPLHIHGELCKLNRNLIKQSNHVFNNLDRMQKVGSAQIPLFVIVCRKDSKCPAKMGISLREIHKRNANDPNARRSSSSREIAQPDSPATTPRTASSGDPEDGEFSCIVLSKSRADHDIRFYPSNVIAFSEWLAMHWRLRGVDECIAPLHLNPDLLSPATHTPIPIVPSDGHDSPRNGLESDAWNVRGDDSHLGGSSANDAPARYRGVTGYSNYHRRLTTSSSPFSPSAYFVKAPKKEASDEFHVSAPTLDSLFALDVEDSAAGDEDGGSTLASLDAPWYNEFSNASSAQEGAEESPDPSERSD
ncbi:unnamed protein product [Vitrella brassicaformis CCMP3155]|uniref:Serine aminopeptidase S33 domain-containing protein n=2 Tax=Vitrella brassicaformis TaxID=1169539 RepID=A0A0G4EII9_VITBC|nr:unnamed protein product [Vitrella brassicaformis CCMP3155]|eukprot:CEL95818.1 unnamed protein product [Vitrella brassicaformis CCMP3155]